MENRINQFSLGASQFNRLSNNFLPAHGPLVRRGDNHASRERSLRDDLRLVRRRALGGC